MAPFRIVFASDLHFAKKPKQFGFVDAVLNLKKAPAATLGAVFTRFPSQLTSHDPDIADAFSNWVYVNKNEIDLLLIGGDLATSGDDDDLLAAKEYVFNPVNSKAPSGFKGVNGTSTLQTVPNKIVVIPGNHDRYDGFSPGGTRFDTHFARNWHQQPVQVLCNEDCSGFRVILVGADLTLRMASDSQAVQYGIFTIPGHWGQGYAYKDILDELVRTTTELRKKFDPCILFWVIHFDPLCQDDSLALLKNDELATAAQKTDVDAVLCGHTHEASADPTRTLTKLDRRGRKVPVFVSGSTTQFMSSKPNSFLSLTIHNSSTPVIPQIHKFDKKLPPAFTPNKM